ncbi:MAG: hypothetical protein PHE78_02420 [Candidatus Gastranaerophilales bacterium]|nr:hypothetical protein [Candidatus Gastranaerophilales bacterium]
MNNKTPTKKPKEIIINYLKIAKSKVSEFVTFVTEKTKMDRKQAKLVITIVILILVSLIDILWLVIPYHPKDKTTNQAEYKMEDIPELVNKYQQIISKDPKNFKAHYELGKIYLFVKEREKAKVEFFLALENAPKDNYSASFAITKLYIEEKSPEMAEKMIDTVNYSNLTKEDFLQKADLLFEISKIYYGQNKFNESYNTLQESYNDYAQSNSTEKLELAKTDMIALLVDMADQAYYVQKNPTKAVVYLDNAQKIKENPWAYARMGYLFFENPRLSAEYFDKAYSFTPSSVNLEIFIYTLAQAIEQCKALNLDSDKSYYRGVLERVRSENLSAKIQNKIILTNMEGLFEKQANTDDYLPLIYFDIHNAMEKTPINYLKVRAVFVDINAKIIGHRDMIIINAINPLNPQKSVTNIRMEANRTIKGSELPNNVYTVLLYISKDRPDSWSYAASKMIR